MRDLFTIAILVLVIIVGATSCNETYNRYYCSCTQTFDDKVPVTTDYTIEAKTNYEGNTFCNDIEQKVKSSAGEAAVINCGLK